ncbi:MAG: 50S ribosomal protein L23 [Bacillota bacterium]
MANIHDIIIKPIVTEASMIAMENNKYTFKVLPRANKTQIKKAVSEIFDVEVVKVNTMNVKGKVKRMGRNEGKRADWKKAIVKLAPGNEIELFEGMA